METKTDIMISLSKNIVMDLDGTICPIKKEGESYADLLPYPEIVAKLHEYKMQGFRIVILTARNMRTYNGDIALIKANTLPVIIDWLAKHEIPYDEVHVGKPWSGYGGFYVDDKAIRPDEFLRLGYGEILTLIGDEQHD
jgi:capsule biosynthesis phosphatase